MDWQLFLGAFAAALQLYSFLPYFLGIFRRQVKPHAFTWLIWGLLSGITFAAQQSQHAGAGAWLTGVNTLACLTAAILALKYGHKSVTRSDWWALGFGLLAIPVWIATHDPLGSVLIVCVIDIVAFWPTVRKSWANPYHEAIQTFLLSGIAALVSIMAMESLNVVTILYPACLAALNLLFVPMVLLRRQIVNKS